MRLKPSCSWCKDYSKFIENIQLRILLQCYKRLALYIKRSDISKKWANLQTGNTPGVLIGSSANSIYNQNNCPLNFKELIDEGSNLPDKYTFFEPSLRNLNKSNAQTLNSNSSSDSLDNKSFQTINSNFKSVLDKKDDHLTSKPQFQQATIVRLTTNADNSFQNQLITNSLNNQLNDSSTISLNSINQTTTNSSSNTPTKTKQNKVRKGCRCGLATLNPGKLTCCGQRCPCYVECKACFECKCRGCRNPNKSNQHQNETYTNKHNNLITNRTNRESPISPILITTSSAINISTNNSSNLISTSPNLFTSSSLNSNNNQTALLSSTASSINSTRNLLSPSFLLSSSTPSSATLISASNANQMLKNSNNIFQTGTKFNIISSTSSSPAIFLGHHNNVGSVSTVGVDSLTLPFPSIEDQVEISENVCIEEEDPSSLHQSISEIITVNENDEI